MVKSIELYAANIPGIIGWVADHFWLVINFKESDYRERWEVWQLPDVAGESWGHLHKNLMTPEQGVGGRGSLPFSPARHITTWSGADARALLLRLHSAPTEYPYCDLYHYWPGPNSNTFIQWVLDAIEYELDATAIGKDYRSCATFESGSEKGALLHFNMPIAGVKYRKGGGWSCHLLGFALGYQFERARILFPTYRPKIIATEE